MPTRSELEAAYRAAIYRVFLPAGAIDLNIDAASPGLAAWLRQEGRGEWAILTAANPASQPRPAPENAECQAELECALLEEGFEPYAGENISGTGDWPVEETCFVPGIALPEAMALASRFGQNAFVFGAADGVPHLVWTESTGNEQDNRSV